MNIDAFGKDQVNLTLHSIVEIFILSLSRKFYTNSSYCKNLQTKQIKLLINRMLIVVNLLNVIFFKTFEYLGQFV